MFKHEKIIRSWTMKFIPTVLRKIQQTYGVIMYENVNPVFYKQQVLILWKKKTTHNVGYRSK